MKRHLRLVVVLTWASLGSAGASYPGTPTEDGWRAHPRAQGVVVLPLPQGPLAATITRIQLEHIATEMCRQMEAWVGWVRGFNGEPCVEAQLKYAVCRPDGSGSNPAESCAADFAHEAREWLALMHQDLFSLKVPVPAFPRVAPLTPAALNSRLASAGLQPRGQPSANATPRQLHQVPMGPRPGAQNVGELSAREVFRQAQSSVWIVVSASSYASLSHTASQGSAVAVHSRFLLTACHVVQGRDVIFLAQGTRTVNATLVGQDPATDRCILSVQENLTAVRGIRAFNELEVGERVFTLAAPRALDLTLGEGIVASLRRVDGSSIIQTNATMAPGSSGGALLDARGNLVGIIVSRIRGEAGLGFAIAADGFWPGR